MENIHSRGFTLIEVLLALVIIAISLTALIRATGQDIQYTHRLRQNTTSHWVAWQAVNRIQSSLISVGKGSPQTFKTTMLNDDWYWRPQLVKTGIPNVSKIIISISPRQSGPFKPLLIAYKLDL